MFARLVDHDGVRRVAVAATVDAVRIGHGGLQWLRHAQKRLFIGRKCSAGERLAVRAHILGRADAQDPAAALAALGARDQ